MTDDPKKSEPQGDEPGHTWHDDTPFPKRWIGYVVLKVLILIIAVVVGLWWYGLL